MIRLTVRLVGTDPSTREDVELVRSESDQYDPDILDALMLKCLAQATQSTDATTLKLAEPMVGVELFADEDEAIRPSLHFSRGTISRLAEIGADVDFDPYV